LRSPGGATSALIRKDRSIIANPTIYALSMAVYCTTWTFYGSVGRAAVSGIGFLPVYLGPTLVMALGWFLLLKMIRIVKANRITSIADFISSRYGKSHLLGGLVTIIAVLGIIPYIALQLKAVSSSVSLLLSYPEIVMPNRSATMSVAADISFYIALILAAFTIVFGTRHLDATERHEGMVAAIALESGVKLVAFLAVGVYVTYGMYEGFGDIFEHIDASPELQRLATAIPSGKGYTGWFSLIVLSAMAVLFLPRQFQVAVVENVNEAHLKRAAWLFPLYLLLINVFVSADRARRSAAFCRAGRRCRHLRADPADVAAAGGSDAAGLHRGPVGRDRDGHRRNHRLVDDGLQRPGDAAADTPPARCPR
jgi:Na+/proline symporter